MFVLHTFVSFVKYTHCYCMITHALKLPENDFFVIIKLLGPPVANCIAHAEPRNKYTFKGQGLHKLPTHSIFVMKYVCINI